MVLDYRQTTRSLTDCDGHSSSMYLEQGFERVELGLWKGPQLLAVFVWNYKQIFIRFQ